MKHMDPFRPEIMNTEDFHPGDGLVCRRDRVVLCVPNVPRCPDNSSRLFTLALLYLKAAAGQAGWGCDLVDAYLENLNAGETAGRILAGSPPALIGFSLYTPRMWEEALLVIAELRKALGRPPAVVVGGHYATFRADELLTRYPQISYVIAGEGEKPLRQLLIALKSGSSFHDVAGLKRRGDSGEIREGPPSCPEPNIDDLGHIEFGRVAKRINPDEWSLSTSRGCPGACSFCISSRHWGKAGWRGHSPEWIVDRLCELFHKHKATWINIVDDNFFGASNPVSRARAISESMQARRVHVPFSIMARADTVCTFPEAFLLLRNAGLSQVFLGLESGNDSTLEKMEKGIDTETGEGAVDILGRLGIGVTLGNIVFHPWMTKSSVLADLDYLEKLLRKHPGARFFGLNELDIFSPTPLGKSFSPNENPPWLCEWKAEDPQIQAVLEEWRLIRSGILFPAMQIFPPSSSPEIRRAYDFWQLGALRTLIAGHDAEERFSRASVSMCRFLLTQGGNEVLDTFLMQQRSADPTESAPHPERCFA